MNLKIDRINLQSIVFENNLLRCIRIPDFSKILDISFYQDQVEILYSYLPYQPNDKIVNIWITSNENICPPPSDDYYYWGKIQKQNIEPVDLSHTNFGKVLVSHDIKTYYLFLLEIKSISELRDQIIENITNG